MEEKETNTVKGKKGYQRKNPDVVLSESILIRMTKREKRNLDNYCKKNELVRSGLVRELISQRIDTGS